MRDLAQREGTEKEGSRARIRIREVFRVPTLGEGFPSLGSEQKAVNRLGCWGRGEAGRLY